MYRLALADANAIAILKLLSPFHSSVTLQTTSLPLPKGHPPPGLLAKLNLYVASLYTGAKSSFQSNSGVEGSIDANLMNYLSKEAALADIRARKWLGVEAGETAGGQKTGLALAWLKDAQRRIAELQNRGQVGATRKQGIKDKMKGWAANDRREERKERRGRLEVEQSDIESFIQVYLHLNKTVRTATSRIQTYLD